MLAQADAVVRPHLIMAETEVERLSTLALQMEPSAPLAADLLLREIDRAEIRPDAAMPDHVVRMLNRAVRDGHERALRILKVEPPGRLVF
uniref:hypothetical protein n=1 Tax=uncultured Caulobacter sp. TaxID=158749 RepID=UPI0025F510A1|nr:hypothetical protein [uncultured Caulobacter sp.]